MSNWARAELSAATAKSTRCDIVRLGRWTVYVVTLDGDISLDEKGVLIRESSSFRCCTARMHRVP